MYRLTHCLAVTNFVVFIPIKLFIHSFIHSVSIDQNKKLHTTIL